MTVEAEVVARSSKAGVCWLRVPYRQAHRILTLPDAVLPFGCKGRDRVTVRVERVRPGRSGWTADVEVLT